MTSRTYNDLGNGTYGQRIASYRIEDSFVAGDKVWLVQLAHSPDPGTGFRTNIGLINHSQQSIVIEIALYRGDGTYLDSRWQTLEPCAWSQQHDVFRHVTDEALDTAFAVVSSASPGARFFTYASVVDNRSGDPVYIAGETLPKSR